MGWRERFGADDERARVAARARALLTAAGDGPSPGPRPPGVGASEVEPEAAATSPPAPPVAAAPPAFAAEPPPPPRGGWVPTALSPHAAPLPGGRHSRDPLDDLPVSSLSVDRLDGPARGDRWPPREPTVDDGRVPWRERIRFEPGRRGLVAVAAVVVVVGSVAGGVLFRGGQSSAVTLAAASGAPAPSAASPAPVDSGSGSRSASAAGTPSPSAASSAGGTVTVDVAGLVAHPGVYTLPAGSRVEDALRAAGGARSGADLSTVNRARVLVDGEQLAVGVAGAPAGAGAPASSASGAGGSTAAPGALVDLNTADLTALDTLPGVGPVLAQKILDWRTEHGRFGSVDDLQQVSGIGPTRFADLRDLVTV